jgi:hypothetical protein
MPREPTPRKDLSADALYRQIYHAFETLPDPHPHHSGGLADALMSGFAVFALKDPSLLAFDERRRQDAKNLEMIFHIGHVPCDTGLREVLDPVDPEQVRPLFRQIFAELGRGGVLPEMLFLDDDYLLALDGTEYFLSGIAEKPVRPCWADIAAWGRAQALGSSSCMISSPRHEAIRVCLHKCHGGF